MTLPRPPNLLLVACFAAAMMLPSISHTVDTPAGSIVTADTGNHIDLAAPMPTVAKMLVEHTDRVMIDLPAPLCELAELWRRERTAPTNLSPTMSSAGDYFYTRKGLDSTDGGAAADQGVRLNC